MSKTGIPDGWAFPNPVMFGDKAATGGMVWIGTRRMSADDKAELRKVMGPSVLIDPRSVVGKYDMRWTTFFNYYTDNPIPSGGVGSECYELQLVGEVGGGVKFADEPIFAFNPQKPEDGLIFAIPPDAGAYHQLFSGGYVDNFWGPEPGSEADRLHSGGTYLWNRSRKLYEVKK